MTRPLSRETPPNLSPAALLNSLATTLTLRKSVFNPLEIIHVQTMPFIQTTRFPYRVRYSNASVARGRFPQGTDRDAKHCAING
jgi:hypothetical protein